MVDYALGQTFGDGGLAYARFADQQRIVLASTAQSLDHAFQFHCAADQRIYLAGERLFVEVGRVGFQSATGGSLFAVLGLLATLGLGLFRLGALGDAMRDEIHHVQSRYPLLMQEVNRMRIFFTKNGNQHVGASDFLFAGALDMQDGALDDPLKSQRWLGIDFLGASHGWRVATDEFGELFAKVVQARRAGA